MTTDKKYLLPHKDKIFKMFNSTYDILENGTEQVDDNKLTDFFNHYSTFLNTSIYKDSVASLGKDSEKNWYLSVVVTKFFSTLGDLCQLKPKNTSFVGYNNEIEETINGSIFLEDLIKSYNSTVKDSSKHTTGLIDVPCEFFGQYYNSFMEKNTVDKDANITPNEQYLQKVKAETNENDDCFTL